MDPAGFGPAGAKQPGGKGVRPKRARYPPDTAKPRRLRPKPKGGRSAANAAEHIGEKTQLTQRDEDEVAECWSVQVSRKDAFSGPGWGRWLEAGSLEKAPLEALGWWRPFDDGESTESEEMIPSVALRTRKGPCADHPRGRFKARLVGLGNRQTKVSEAEIYSPAVAHAANRYLLAESAARGYHILQFGISNASVGARLEDDRVFGRLPKHWSAPPKGGKVRLPKSPYGFKISPRRWFATCRTFLEANGWETNPREPGLFQEGGMRITIYFGGSVISGPCARKCRAEMGLALPRFAGKEAFAEKQGAWQARDALGTVLRYGRSRRI